MIKKKYLFILLVTLLLGLSGHCYAAVNMVPSSFNKSTVDVWDYLIENYYASVGDITDSSNFSTASGYSNSYANFQALENLIYSTDYVVFYNRSSSYTNNLYVALSDSDIVFYNNNTNITGSAKKKSLTVTLSLYGGKYAVPNQRFK